uniref:uncharacterized protein LOC130490240 n=1 Tax=Euleptes europaea TaxID=460621 RepID=UPI00254098D5|nr:uncharacterized protein LOC130490240 [Euleptes europaea]
MAKILFASKTRPCLSVLGTFLLLLRSDIVHSDAVFQSHSQISITEGQEAVLPCNFSTTDSSPYLFWYRKFPNKSPEHLLTKIKSSSWDQKLSSAKYSATLNLETKTVDLKIKDVSLQDAAAYFCALRATTGGFEKMVFGQGTRLTVRPGIPTKDFCNSSRGLTVDIEKVSATVWGTGSAFGKVIFGRGTKLSVNPTNFCQGKMHCGYDGNWKLIFGSGTKLVVTPNLENSEPSLYQLKSQEREHENISACLITDYFPGTISAGLNDNVKPVDSSLVVTEDGGNSVPSYGTVLWSNGNFDCHADHGGKRYSLPEDADDADDACLEEDFKTDERLNFLSLTMLGLRIIFLKTVAVNLLLTFRLWSC